MTVLDLLLGRPLASDEARGRQIGSLVCTGVCDLTNVMTVSHENGTQRFVEITQFEQYRDLVDRATRSRDAGELLPLPKEFQRHTVLPNWQAPSHCLERGQRTIGFAWWSDGSALESRLGSWPI
jgi:hypothetical protein